MSKEFGSDSRIAVAATSDFDWAEAVDSMVRENVSQEYAEKIATKISVQIWATRHLRDHQLKVYWDRIELGWWCFGMIALAAVIGAAVVYRSEIIGAIGHVARCVAGQ